MDKDSRYLALWHRMDRVVQGYSAQDRKDEADHHIADFYLCFDDIDELAKHVKIAEDVFDRKAT